MKEWFNNNILTHKKRYIVIGIVLLILLIFGGIALFSHGFYSATSSNLILTGTAEIDGADIRLRIYLQEHNGTDPLNSYVESTNTEVSNEYIFNPEKSHCSANEKIIADNQNKLTISYGQRGSCSAYYDYINGDYDIASKIYIEQEDGTFRYSDNKPADSNHTVSTALSDCIGHGTVKDDGTIAFTGKGTCIVVYVRNGSVAASLDEPSAVGVNGDMPNAEEPSADIQTTEDNVSN